MGYIKTRYVQACATQPPALICNVGVPSRGGRGKPTAPAGRCTTAVVPKLGQYTHDT